MDISEVKLNYSLKLKTMKRFKSIADWLKTNPSEEEQTKVLILIHRGETSRLRKELWEKEQYLRKLNSFANHCKKLGFSVPVEEKESLAKTKRVIEEIKKELPPVQKRETKTKEVLAESSEK
jgi:hypothetical protein